MNYKFCLLLLIIFLCSINCIVAGGGDSSIEYTQYNVVTYQDITYASEDGHFDINFDNGYNGYCFEYGEQEAKKGDKFYVEATDYILNTEGKDVSNILKVYFVDYYNETQKDKIVTQHTIWHFTDNFDGWRVNKTLVNDIRQTSEYKNIPDTGLIKYNETHNMIFDFRSFISPFEHHQNFFGYKINFEQINNQNMTNNTTNNTININNTTNIFNNITNINNTTNIINNITNINNTTNIITNTNNTTNINNYYNINIVNITPNQTIKYFYIYYIYIINQSNNIHTIAYQDNQQSNIIHLQNYITGNPIFFLFIGLGLLAIRRVQ